MLEAVQVIQAWASVAGALLVTAGSGVQAFRELESFRRFYDSVLAAHERLVDDQARRLLATVEIWHFRRRAAIRRHVRRDGERLLTDDERATRRDIDLRALGWVLVCSGGALTTATTTITALT